MKIHHLINIVIDNRTFIQTIVQTHTHTHTNTSILLVRINMLKMRSFYKNKMHFLVKLPNFNSQKHTENDILLINKKISLNNY